MELVGTRSSVHSLPWGGRSRALAWEMAQEEQRQIIHTLSKAGVRGHPRQGWLPAHKEAFSQAMPD